ncbi:MAG TPA: cytochrome c3 family protein, partial [Thermoanaerobaculia bacterium]|nr:cytochrome c3 family protein [Thermoanaerobaculia bacterium]
KDPNHATAGFPTTCDTCHRYTDASWDQGVFNHVTFALAGAHLRQACSACHIGGVYAGTPRTCVACHLSAYNGTRNPNHAAAGFPTTCETCHHYNDNSWTEAVFNHSAFALAGVHATRACTDCHGSGVYLGTPRQCAGCHLARYNATTAPNHASAGFPTTCDDCHKYTDTSWNQGVFNHSAFPLAGRHLSQSCTACHIGGVYAGTPRTCAGCHLSDYNSARDPNHAAAGFPTTCDSCHRFADSSWDQGVFNHTRFPIATGRHAGNPCGACHTTPVNFLLFSCTTNCHSRPETDSEHDEVAGYRYDSLACYSCHPQGRAD